RPRAGPRGRVRRHPGPVGRRRRCLRRSGSGHGRSRHQPLRRLGRPERDCMTKSTTQRHVVITDQEYELPYSKGLMASSIMATGLSPARAFHVAEVVEERLADAGRNAITRAELTDLALDVLREEVGARYAESVAKWQLVNRL